MGLGHWGMTVRSTTAAFQWTTTARRSGTMQDHLNRKSFRSSPLVANSVSPKMCGIVRFRNHATP